MWRILIAASLVFFLFQNFVAVVPPASSPDFPLINIDTRTIQKNSTSHLYETMTPHLPVHDLTFDGRIGVRKRGAPGGAPLFVLKPERVKKHLIDQSNPRMGAGMIDDEPDYIFNSNALRPRLPAIRTGYSGERTFLCEKFLKRRNPYVCQVNSDCYDLTLITRFNSLTEDKSYLVAVDATVQVLNPKTANASIGAVTFDYSASSLKIGPVLAYPKVAEPVVVGDNRLLVVRLGQANNLTLSDGVTPATGSINIVYSTYPERDANGALTEQCDVSKWTPQTMHPISHAPYDTTVNQMPRRYKFARYKFRDSFGKLMPNGADMGGSYQWMDRGATNLMLTSFGTDSFYNISARLGLVKPYAEPTGSYYLPASDPLKIELVEEVSSPTAGIVMMGFWTRGKAVLLDGQLNNADYNFRIAERVDSGSAVNVQRQLQLYSGAPVDQTFEPVGGVRELGKGFESSLYSPHLSLNSSYLGSLENRFTYLDSMFPVTPRDVVWHVGSTRHTDEVVFDDYINPYMFIYSDMTGSVGQLLQSSMQHFDGILNGARQTQESEEDRLSHPNQPGNGQLAFQNAATGNPGFIKVPLYGVPDGDLRLEPIAKGGISGKGVWFNSNAAIRYPIPRQGGTQLDLPNGLDWYVSAFLDPREVDSTPKERGLFSLSSGERVTLAKISGSTLPEGIAYSQVILRGADGSKISEIILPLALRPRNGDWVHLAIQFKYGSLPVLYINGFRYGTFLPGSGVPHSTVNSFFRIMDANEIILGGRYPNPSVRGWLDEFKVIARVETSEERCNHAHGTLLDIDAVTDIRLKNIAASYPIDSHAKLKVDSNLSGTQFLCYVNYGGPAQKQLHSFRARAHFKNLPANSLSVRKNILLRQKGLVYGKPRPDLSSNRFCLSCHTQQYPGSFAEMDVRALIRNPLVNAEDDPRRQPMQPAAKFRGVVPANYFGPKLPVSTIYCPSSGCKIDQWVLGR